MADAGAHAAAAGHHHHAPPAHHQLSSEEAEQQRLAAEKEQKERALQERLEKRGAIVATVVRKFLAAFAAAKQGEIDAAKAAAAAKAAGKGRKKGAKAKKDAKQDKKAGGKDGGKKKGKPSSPLAEAWAAFIADMDDRINKQKRVGLEDLYRALNQLEPSERTALSAAVNTANKKVLPVTNMNANQINIKAMIYSATAAYDYPVDKVENLKGAGLNMLRDRGASAAQMLQHGFKEGDLLRAGYTPEEVITSNTCSLRGLRIAGVPVADVLACTPQGPLKISTGRECVAALRQAGYGAGQLAAGNLRNAWDLRKAGYSLSELADAGLQPSDLRAAGFGCRELQPSGFISETVQKAHQLDPAQLLPFGEGLRGSQTWQALLPTQVAGKAGPLTRPGSGGRNQPRGWLNTSSAPAQAGPAAASALSPAGRPPVLAAGSLPPLTSAQAVVDTLASAGAGAASSPGASQPQVPALGQPSGSARMSVSGSSAGQLHSGPMHPGTRPSLSGTSSGRVSTSSPLGLPRLSATVSPAGSPSPGPVGGPSPPPG